ncbi:hypothetical protein C8Q80DRAFT_1116841 [Daedaleopsis nitida]|nr:hypothetical protein C8Q80DRAFT_1116841 [Daedaleopsis nitida]
MVSVPSPPSSTSCYGTLAFWVLLMDTAGSDSTSRFINTVLSTALFGIATSLAIASTYILCGKGLARRATAILLSAVFVLYASTTVFWGAALNRNLVYTREAAAAADAVSSCDVQALLNPVRTSAVNDRMSCVQTATLTINILVGDAVVWWRASLIWTGRSRYAIFALCSALLLATFAISVADTCGSCNLDLVREESGYGQLFAGDKLGAVASILSLVTNVVATLLTAYKAWTHARLLRNYFSAGSMMTNVERILILLTETGLVYSGIWVVVAIYQIGINQGDLYDSSVSNVASNFWGVVGYFINGALVPTIAIYPMMIIVLVALKKSQMDRSFESQESGSSTAALSTHIPMSPSLSPTATRTRAFSVRMSTLMSQRRDRDSARMSMSMRSGAGVPLGSRLPVVNVDRWTRGDGDGIRQDESFLESEGKPHSVENV